LTSPRQVTPAICLGDRDDDDDDDDEEEVDVDEVEESDIEVVVVVVVVVTTAVVAVVVTWVMMHVPHTCAPSPPPTSSPTRRHVSRRPPTLSAKLRNGILS
jgi:hypothetical protein